MADQEFITEDILPESGDVNPADSSEAETVSLKDLLGKELGKEFDSDESALKAVKDTFSYVGKKKEAIAEEVKSSLGVDTSNLESRLKSIEEENFFSSNPGYNTPEIRSLIKEMAGNRPLSDVVNSETFKTVFEKVKAHDEIASSKSVLQSNPRLGKSFSALDEAKEAASKGDTSTASKMAVKAVLESLE